MEKLWQTMDELDECLWQYVPPATARENNVSEFMGKLRKKFPLLHKRISKKTYNRLISVLKDKE